ncbi:hypothetical protein [Nannocystis punicea]|uniref:Uncharacterized protein n=1 Tax=Nannocystis punicea TaxID=2995304 RepID=A0ABY7GVY8_9BACT|nr:hypothetical protein [Nannocystis poenicansa]WAS91054.1 hypothetical protein O0S08_33110 [Nannocystis poenicansa]
MAHRQDLAVLARLLTELFAVEELRRFPVQVADAGDLEHELPGAQAGHADVAHALVRGLERRGLLDAEFFVRLRAQRPRRAREIDDIADRWMCSRPADPPRPRRPRRWLLVAVAAALGLVAFAAGRQWTTTAPRRVEERPVVPPMEREPEPLRAAPPEPTVNFGGGNIFYAPKSTVTVTGIQQNNNLR